MADEHGTTPVGTQAHEVGGKLSSPAQYMPDGQPPLHWGYVSPQAFAIDVELVDVLDVVVVDVVVGTQSPPPHASQQLGTVPTQAVPPLGARQRAASLFTLQRKPPETLVRQQVTAPARPHVERAAQRLTAPLHSVRSCPRATRVVSTPEAQLTYAPWVAMPTQSQVASIAVRAAVVALASAA